ncbi:hypothetical protein NLG97_g9522 [Lecanicillium saksenae]|uniref:Uncharacterized protein n=1 Tax=Lecanicillium saksenae TaxID=468837 RepID=A0ACC1QG08_9HYPO|nr:hypothetical protein NLG97_g9522 [Lecanicillium saksenae]
MSAAAARPSPPPPHGNGGSGRPDGYKHPRRSIEEVLIEGDSDDSAFDSADELPRLRRTTTQLIELIRSGEAIEAPAPGAKHTKGYNVPVPLVEFSPAVLRWNATLEWTRANPRTGQDAYAANVAEISPAATQGSSQVTPGPSQPAAVVVGIQWIGRGTSRKPEESHAQPATIQALPLRNVDFQKQVLAAMASLAQGHN